MSDGSSSRSRRWLATIVTILAGSAIVLGALFVGLRLSGWSGLLGAIGYRAHSTVAIGGTGAHVVVPSGWTARRSLRVPYWLGFQRNADVQNMVILNPLKADGRELGVDWGSPAAQWSDITQSERLVHLDPGAELEPLGVRRVLVRSSRNRASAVVGGSDVHLFVDNPAGRYLISLTVAVPPSSVTTSLVASSLRQGGFSFK